MVGHAKDVTTLFAIHSSSPTPSGKQVLQNIQPSKRILPHDITHSTSILLIDVSRLLRSDLN